MSVLSITAPQFTSEDERLEQETYTPEELDGAQKDVWGKLAVIQDNKTDAMEQEDTVGVAAAVAAAEQKQQQTDSAANSNEQQEANGEKEEDLQHHPMLLEDMEQALNEIPLEEKDAYLEAMERVPQLVELESHPSLFLKAENYDPWAAAERLVNYWELRRWLFGDRAWLPMTSTGNGSLCQEDVQLLQTGFCTLLDQDDASDRGVICFQVTKRKLEYDRMAMVRVIFYVLTVALERPSVQANGLVLVADTKNYTTSRFDRKFIKCVAYLFTGYHPITTRAYHICAPPGKSCFLLVLPFIRYFMTRHVRQRFLVHMGTTTELVIDLQDYGIPTNRLPKEMGGECSQREFWDDWMEQRRNIELDREEELFGPEEDDDDDEEQDEEPMASVIRTEITGTCAEDVTTPVSEGVEETKEVETNIADENA